MIFFFLSARPKNFLGFPHQYDSAEFLIELNLNHASFRNNDSEILDFKLGFSYVCEYCKSNSNVPI